MEEVINPNFFVPGYVGSTYRPSRIHATKKGPGRSVGMKPKQKQTGRKFAKRAFNGVLGLRNGIGAAGRLALENKLGTGWLSDKSVKARARKKLLG